MPQPHERRIGQAEAVLLLEVLLDLRGHPRLTWWEEGFVTSLQRRVETHGSGTWITEKQQAVLDKLRAKLAPGAAMEEEVPDEAEEDDGLDLVPEEPEPDWWRQ